ncbi:head-tail connector protein [Klebsiella pneumoniae]|uniref:head-tail connector protein n=1 Tax=Klebsiella pneumoniae TaxID=573 RepID=UPI00388D35EA
MEISEEQLAQIKAHLKVDGDDEDTLIAAYASASVDYVERFRRCAGRNINAASGRGNSAP